jgi:FkbM family methyltransferase
MDPLATRYSLLATRLRDYYGVARSLAMYYGIPFQVGRMRRFYARFIRPGDLCFDVGAHVGSRIAAWSRLGARVVAVEPQPTFMRLLRRWYGARPNVALVEQALGATRGEGVMLVSRRTPTLTTLSGEWASRVRHAPGFSGTRWDSSAVVAVTTLDHLIARYGEPRFCKIDVEGYELEVLRGLSRPLPTLSFECIPATADIALGCIERLGQLGSYEFNWSASEWMRLRFRRWLDAPRMAALLRSFPRQASSGDVYARLRSRQ